MLAQMNDRIGVQNTMQEMERLASKGEIAEEELRALEEDVTGKIMLASWRGTRFEVVQVLREVHTAVFRLLFYPSEDAHMKISVGR